MASGDQSFWFILILAGIFLGPGRIAKVARWLGQTTAKLQNISRGFVGQLKAELDMAEGSEDLRDMLKEMQDLRNESTIFKAKSRRLSKMQRRKRPVLLMSWQS